ncbi:YIP1 family protein [Aureivirga sp. CE67]|uniref:YIP1 family protein n=1 Tax=Aureivirga sp. CE67 TaxID=1788983 RepID=UPI0018CA9A6D
MKNILLTAFSSGKNLDLFNEKSKKNRLFLCFIITTVHCYTLSILNFEKDYTTFSFNISYQLFLLAFSSFFSFGFYHAYSFIVFKICQKLNGKAQFLEVFSTFIYSLIPIIFCNLIIGYLKTSDYSTTDWNNYITRNIIILFFSFYSFKIGFIGLKKFNQFGVKKTLIAISPLWILSILFLSFFFLN